MGIVFLLAGCTQATPDFKVLDASHIPQPHFQGATSMTVVVSSTAKTTAIQGECDFKISSIVTTVVGVNQAAGAEARNLERVSLAKPVVSCQSDGKFSFELKGLEDLGFAKAKENQTYEVQLRGVTTAGLSNPSSIYIHLTSPNSNGPKRMLITSGSSESANSPLIARGATSTSFKAVIRVDHLTLDGGATSQQSHSFKAKIGAASSAD